MAAKAFDNLFIYLIVSAICVSWSCDGQAAVAATLAMCVTDDYFACTHCSLRAEAIHACVTGLSVEINRKKSERAKRPSVTPPIQLQSSILTMLLRRSVRLGTKD